MLGRINFTSLVLFLVLTTGWAEKPSKLVTVSFDVYPPQGVLVEQELGGGAVPEPTLLRDGKAQIVLYSDGMVNLRFSKTGHESVKISKPVDFFTGLKDYPEPIALKPASLWVRIEDALHYPTTALKVMGLLILAGSFRWLYGYRLRSLQRAADQRFRRRILELGGSENPETLGSYILLKRLGAGGMAQVWKAIRSDEVETGQPVALKRLHEKDDNNRVAQIRFEQEAARLKAVAHPNLIKVYGVERHEGHLLLAMELLQGKTLAELMKDRNHKALEPALALPILKSVASACDTLHQHNIIHRDLTTNNIMVLDETRRAVVLDLGLSKDTTDQVALTTMSSAMGTVLFYPADPFIAGKDGLKLTTGAYDQFSWAVNAYFLLSGRYPFELGEMPENEWLAIIMGLTPYSPMPIHRVNPKLPESTWTALARAMAFSREDRYSSVMEAYEALEASLTKVRSPEGLS